MMTDSDALEKADLYQQEANCLQAEKHTWRLLDLDDNTWGSGVAVKIGSRHFLATAEHVIPKRHKLEVLQPGRNAPVPQDFADFHCADRSAGVDVGLLELSLEQADAIGDFIGVDNILTGYDRRRRLPALVCGFPVENRGGRGTALTEILRPQKWPAKVKFCLRDDPGIELELAAERDIILVYERWSPRIPDPIGMSGGGVWIDSSQYRTVYAPGVQLIGLQVGFKADRMMLRGIRIAHWLDLVAEHYSDVAEEISRVKKRRLDFFRQP